MKIINKFIKISSKTKIFTPKVLTKKDIKEAKELFRNSFNKKVLKK